MRARKIAPEIGRHVALAILGLLTLAPFLLMLNISLKNNAQFYTEFWKLSRPIQWGNFTYAWNIISRYILNSIIVSGISVIGVLVMSSLSAYSFARFRFPGREFLFFMVIGLLMIPGVLTLVPLYSLVQHFPLVGGNNRFGMGGHGLLNSRWGLIIPYMAGGQIMLIFILRNFFEGIPQSLFDAARVDGASEWHIIRLVVVPLSVPILITVGLMSFLGTWNDYVWPLVVLRSPELRTLPVGLAFLHGEYEIKYGQIMAGYAIGCLPLLVLFVFTMRYFLRGLMFGAIKG
jgi:ABC-type glycerol-3-phosphate transport system permease component